MIGKNGAIPPLGGKRSCLIIAVKLRRRHIKDSRYSEAATEGHIAIKNTSEGVNFCQCRRPYAGSFTKKETLSHAFLNDFAYIFSWQNQRKTNLKKTFQSENFQ